MKKYKISLLFLSLLFFSSCSEWLEEEPLTFLNSSNFYQNDEEATAAVYALYQPLSDLYAQPAYAELIWALWELPGDQTYSNSGVGVVAQDQLDRYEFDTEIKNFEHWWKFSYVIINRSNTVIENIQENENISEGVKKTALGEAHFMRGLAYFELAVGWGGVPKILEGVEELYPSRSSAVDIFNQAVADLTIAEENLPVSWEETEYGRATKYAAKAYLAKIYLTMAGYPLQDASKLSLAASKAKEVIDDGPYELAANVLDNWNPEQMAQEQIFVVNRKRGLNWPAFASYWAPRMHVELAPEPGATYFGAFYPNLEFYNWYPDEDPRKGLFFMDEVTSYSDPSLTVELPFPHVAKYYTPIYSDGSDQDIVRLRFAEVLLIFAEAENEQNGPTSEAFQALNRVRERAFGDDSGDLAGLSKDEFREAVRKERSLELCFEGTSWPDMLRTRKSRNGSIFDYKNIGNISPSETNLLFPIPATEMLANSNLEQNPGY
ncbi:RagB/SusD family nutrient uptake outer membrane protein [Sunxiuqinia elliptica]|uniref:Putative outer membrane starch-binding protein n=1 Tax=Sunxiuqinia elliptica TaxID=655355 RepID=A0A4V3BZ78_9BACT|nr:RagB/SusD family nutrient uptake outer membrane protein [Sunxiuqinia elliptica]TDO05469.1 putative outer membrane starch-binding protein [Sunxiuqinia elliptica]TDO65015.1 putative outer membrane starch-binding protein [Sunxiuqinia elliptica]